MCKIEKERERIEREKAECIKDDADFLITFSLFSFSCSKLSLALFYHLTILRTPVILNIERAVIIRKFRVYEKFRFPREFHVSNETFTSVIEESRESGLRLTEGFPRGCLFRN